MTALQTLIEQLEILKKECEIQAKYFNKKDMPSSSISSSAMAYSYGIAIEKAKQLLETEKQQIIDARENGRQAEYEHHFINDDNNISSNQYYNQLIKKEK